jgi:hypothetical protein
MKAVGVVKRKAKPNNWFRSKKVNGLAYVYRVIWLVIENRLEWGLIAPVLVIRDTRFFPERMGDFM